MISFNLVCDQAHEFEGWFGGNDDFDAQRKKGLIVCPACGSGHVSKALMAPAVTTSKGKERVALAAGPDQQALAAKLTELARAVKANAEDVGDRFAEEARKIHYGETEQRGIYGGATSEEVKDLTEEGIPVMPLPVPPEERN